MLRCTLQRVIHVAGDALCALQSGVPGGQDAPLHLAECDPCCWSPLCALQNAFPVHRDAVLQSADVSRIAHHSTCTLQNAFPAPRDAVLQSAERRPRAWDTALQTEEHLPGIPGRRSARCRAPPERPGRGPALCRAPSGRAGRRSRYYVREGGLEPPHRLVLEPKSSASTNSATLAVAHVYHARWLTS